MFPYSILSSIGASGSMILGNAMKLVKFKLQNISFINELVSPVLLQIARMGYNLEYKAFIQ